jgi:hypothetical protein
MTQTRRVGGRQLNVDEIYTLDAALETQLIASKMAVAAVAKKAESNKKEINE